MYIVLECMASTPTATMNEEGKTYLFATQEIAERFAAQNVQVPVVVELLPMALGYVEGVVFESVPDER